METEKACNLSRNQLPANEVSRPCRRGRYPSLEKGSSPLWEKCRRIEVPESRSSTQSAEKNTILSETQLLKQDFSHCFRFSEGTSPQIILYWVLYSLSFQTPKQTEDILLRGMCFVRRNPESGLAKLFPRQSWLRLIEVVDDVPKITSLIMEMIDNLSRSSSPRRLRIQSSQAAEVSSVTKRKRGRPRLNPRPEDVVVKEKKAHGFFDSATSSAIQEAMSTMESRILEYGYPTFEQLRLASERATRDSGMENVQQQAIVMGLREEMKSQCQAITKALQEEWQVAMEKIMVEKASVGSAITAVCEEASALRRESLDLRQALTAALTQEGSHHSETKELKLAIHAQLSEIASMIRQLQKEIDPSSTESSLMRHLTACMQQKAPLVRDELSHEARNKAEIAQLEKVLNELKSQAGRQEQVCRTSLENIHKSMEQLRSTLNSKAPSKGPLVGWDGLKSKLDELRKEILKAVTSSTNSRIAHNHETFEKEAYSLDCIPPPPSRRRTEKTLSQHLRPSRRSLHSLR